MLINFSFLMIKEHRKLDTFSVSPTPYLHITPSSANFTIPYPSLPLPPPHCGLEQTRIETLVLGHSLVRSLVRSHRSLVRLLHTTCYARALRCTNSLAQLTRLLAPDSLLCSRPPLRSLVCSLAHFAHYLARGKVSY